jgi:hypothetical protein
MKLILNVEMNAVLQFVLWICHWIESEFDVTAVKESLGLLQLIIHISLQNNVMRQRPVTV